MKHLLPALCTLSLFLFIISTALYIYEQSPTHLKATIITEVAFFVCICIVSSLSRSRESAVPRPFTPEEVERGFSRPPSGEETVEVGADFIETTEIDEEVSRSSTERDFVEMTEHNRYTMVIDP